MPLTTTSRGGHLPRFRLAGWLAGIVLLVHALPRGAAAQSQSVTGRVVDSTGVGLAGVAVGVIGTTRRTVTATDGTFALRLSLGRWQLLTRRLGFHPDTTSIDIDPGPDPDPITIQLLRNRIILRSLSVAAPQDNPLSMTVTPETIKQVPPLGEPDIFRAVVVLPTVSQPNDLKGRIHLAGGSSDETGVRLDGHPLQDPFHLFGLFGAFNTAALERANVQIHHVPVRYDGRMSGVIDLHTRTPGDHGDIAVGLLSSAGVWGESITNEIDVLAAGRITYIDKFLQLAGVDARLRDQPLYGYGDLLTRIGWRRGSWTTELLNFYTRDHLTIRDDSLPPVSQSWGESLLGIRSTGYMGDWRLNVRASRNGQVADRPVTPEDDSFIDMSGTLWSAAAEADRTVDNVDVSLGAEIERRSRDQDWFVPGDGDEIFSPHVPDLFSGSQSLTTLTGWGMLSVHVGRHWLIEGGGRVTGGLAGSVADTVRGPWVGPRINISFTPSGPWSFSLAYNRRFQFEAQIEEPIEGSISPPLFLFGRPRQADVVGTSILYGTRSTVGSRIRFDAFYKHYPNRAHETSTIDAPQANEAFPDFVPIEGRAFGLALQGRLNLGETIVEGSYTFQRSLEQLDGADFPTAWDTPHTVVLFGSMPLSSTWTFNALFQAHNGRPVTPVTGLTFIPAGAADNGGLRSAYTMGERHSERAGSFRRLDVGFQHRWRGWGSNWTLYFQVLNVLARTNPVDVDLERAFNLRRIGRFEDGRKGGLPILPSISIEVQW